MRTLNKSFHKKWPLVLGGTLITHLFGGSAGREGTAVQMGGAIADQLLTFSLDDSDRKTLIIWELVQGSPPFWDLYGSIVRLRNFLLQ
jgi:hypothetical protein